MPRCSRSIWHKIEFVFSCKSFSRLLTVNNFEKKIIRHFLWSSLNCESSTDVISRLFMMNSEDSILVALQYHFELCFNFRAWFIIFLLLCAVITTKTSELYMTNWAVYRRKLERTMLITNEIVFESIYELFDERILIQKILLLQQMTRSWQLFCRSASLIE